jgi:hypothetical protein
MKKLEFNDLVNAVLSEDNFLQKLGGMAKTAIGTTAGLAASTLEAPKKIHTAVTGKGQLAKGLRGLQNKYTPENPEDLKRRRPTKTTTDTKIEDFDKDVIKTLLTKSKTGASAAQQTTTGTVQAPGQVAGGTATPTSASGTSSGTVSAPITQSPSATQRDPKEGDVFALVGKYGRVKRYQVKKVDGNIVSAAPMI